MLCSSVQKISPFFVPAFNQIQYLGQLRPVHLHNHKKSMYSTFCHAINCFNQTRLRWREDVSPTSLVVSQTWNRLLRTTLFVRFLAFPLMFVTSSFAQTCLLSPDEIRHKTLSILPLGFSRGRPISRSHKKNDLPSISSSISRAFALD